MLGNACRAPLSSDADGDDHEQSSRPGSTSLVGANAPIPSATDWAATWQVGCVYVVGAGSLLYPNHWVPPHFCSVLRPPTRQAQCQAQDLPGWEQAVLAMDRAPVGTVLADLPSFALALAPMGCDQRYRLRAAAALRLISQRVSRSDWIKYPPVEHLASQAYASVTPRQQVLLYALS